MLKSQQYSFGQRVAKRILPESWFQKIEHDSRCWIYKCTNCGHERSVWDMGGIRYRGLPTRKLTVCTKCKKTGLANVTHKSAYDRKSIGECKKNTPDRRFLVEGDHVPHCSGDCCGVSCRWLSKRCASASESASLACLFCIA